MDKEDLIKKSIDDLEYGLHELDERIQELNQRQSDIAQLLSNFNRLEDEELHDELLHIKEQREELLKLKEDTEKRLNDIQDAANLPQQNNGFRRAAKSTRTIIKLPVSAAVSVGKDLNAKANPLCKPISKQDTADTGVESLRMTIGSMQKSKKAIKTIGQTIKTTQRTIKTAGSAVKATGRIAYNTAAFAAKTVTKTVRLAGTAATHIIATLMNPGAAVVIGIAIVALLSMMFLVVILGGGASSAASNKHARMDAVGLEDVPEEYKAGQEFFRIAVRNRRSGFNALIDTVYYRYDDLQHSDLIYMVRSKPGLTTTYSKSFATDSRKSTLKSAWELVLTEREAIAIAYVYLEKIENEVNGTENSIYQVTFTQEIFDTIVAKCAVYSNTRYINQRCTDQNCTRNTSYEKNPDHAEALEAVNTAAAAYNDWAEIARAIEQNSQLSGIPKSIQWTSYVQPKINAWIQKFNQTPSYTNNGYDFLKKLGEDYEDAREVYDSTPEFIEIITYTCDLQHTLHSVGLVLNTATAAMNALQFTDAEKKWVELTLIGFEQNPDIP